LCKATGDFNLSFESLTNRDALKHLVDVQTKQPELWSKITTSRNRLQDADDEDADDRLDPFADDVEFEDDTSVPLAVVVDHVGSPEMVLPEGCAVSEDGSLAVEIAEADSAGDVSDHDRALSDDEYGRGKRRKLKNRQYDAFWQH